MWWSNFVFNAFLYLEPVQRSENVVRNGRPGSYNIRSKNILDVLKVLELRFKETVLHGIAAVKSGMNKRCASSVRYIKVKKMVNATIVYVVEKCTRDRRDPIRQDNTRINKRLCYCRGTVRRATSVEILWPFFD